jgi:hypothetical protein
MPKREWSRPQKRKVAAESRSGTGGFICCAVCFNLTGGERVPMVTIVKGYATCAEHVELVSTPGFDIFRLRSDPSQRRDTL